MRIRLPVGWVGIFALMVALTLGAHAWTRDLPRGPVPGRFVVKLAPRTSLGTVSQSLSVNQHLQRPSQLILDNTRVGARQWERVYLLHTDDPGATSEQIRNQLGRDNVEYVEQDHYLEFFDLPSDPLFPRQWYLNNTGQEFWAVERIEGPFNDTLAIRSGTPGNDIGVAHYYDNPVAASTRVVVAVIDTGIDPTHPDLQGRLWQNPDEIPDNGIDDDHNGFIDDIIGYDVSGDSLSLFDVVGDSDPTDIIGHGTHIAGIVAAADNSVGIAGISSAAEIMSVKIRPNGTTAVGAMGIIYAVNAGADILNLSWGTPFESLVLRDAVQFACDNGVLVCVSAGNSGDLSLHYPAAFEESFTIGAGDASGHTAWFSTYGSHLDLVAPGQDILSLRATGTDMYGEHEEPNVHIVGDDSLYYLANGTSMAAPMVAGAAAMIWSIRPEMTLAQLEADIRAGARDMLDPFGVGDSLPGFDSLSGYGYLDIRNSLELARNGGIYFVTPEPRSRHTVQMQIKAAPIGGYSGGWELAYATLEAPNAWHYLASGGFPPTDSILHTLSDPALNGHLILRLTDDYNVARTVRTVLVSETRLEITSPQADHEYDYNVPISGSVYGPDYIAAAIYYRSDGGPRELLYETGGEFFDSLIYSWNASGVTLGSYTLYLEGSFESGTQVDSVQFDLGSAFALGWPRNIGGRAGLSAIAADINNDGTREIIVGTTFGLNVFAYNGQPLAGFPTLVGTSVRGVPAAYDVDRDGLDEIICTGDSAIHVFNHDGTYVAGWPRNCDLGHLGHGSPTPSVVELTNDDGSINEDSAIVVMDAEGSILAYDFDGSSYFESLEGWFTSFNTGPTSSVYFNGNGIASTDLDGDDRHEVVVTYSSTVPHAGVAVFDGRTGQPAFDRDLPYVVEASGVFGTVLADLNGDNLPEIITSGFDATGAISLWAKTGGINDLPGWPIALPEVHNWMGVYPTVADLDLDGIPEVVVSFYEFDIGGLYIFRADGSPYYTVEGRPTGEAFRYAATFGVPIVADLLGDAHPEVIIRSGHVFPGAGREEVHILDYTMTPVPGWPIATPTDPSQVFSTPYAPMVDDIDNDGLVEMILVGEGMTVFVWDFEASVNEGRNRGRLFMDNLNSSVLDPDRLVTDVADASTALPRQFLLHQNYPNPFNPSTAISFETPTRSTVTLDIFNVLGQRVTTLVNQDLPPGSHTVEFDGAPFASGVYLYRLKTDAGELTRKMVLLK